MDFRDSPDEAAFRQRLREWLVHNNPGLPASSTDDDSNGSGGDMSGDDDSGRCLDVFTESTIDGKANIYDIVHAPRHRIPIEPSIDRGLFHRSV